MFANTSALIYHTFQMKRIILFLLCCIPLYTNAKGVEDLYIMWSTTTHKLYYFYEQNIDSYKNKTLSYSYDISYADTSQISTYHFSLIAPQVIAVDSIAFIVGTQCKTYTNLQKIYIEKSKKGWLHRYELSIPLEDIKETFSPSQHLQIALYTNEGELKFQQHSANAWKKRCEQMCQVFQVIQLNKQ